MRSILCMAVILVTGSAFAGGWYVSDDTGDDSNDGASWETAKKSIQAAVNAASPRDTVSVTDGIYAPITTANKIITIQSVNGATATIIDGGGVARCATLGSSAIHTNTVLIGFTLRNGKTNYGGGSYYGTLNACTLSGNSATTYGGGAHGGVLNACTLSGNSAKNGGGAYESTLNTCTLSGNSADAGGGAYGGTLNNCTVSGNEAASKGGGTYNGKLNNCMLSGNSATADGGGAWGGTLNNCTLSGNEAARGGGGAWGGTLNNCIVWGNTVPGGVSSNYLSGTFAYSCTAPSPGGTGNIVADPLFANATRGNFRLLENSPCVNAGNNALVAGVTDLAGKPRIVGTAVDIGAYEWDVGSELPLSDYEIWLEDNSLTDTSENYTKWLIDPDDLNAVLTAHIEMVDGKAVITWSPNLRDARVYTIEGKEHLTDPTWTVINPWIPPATPTHFFRVEVALP